MPVASVHLLGYSYKHFLEQLSISVLKFINRTIIPRSDVNLIHYYFTKNIIFTYTTALALI